MSKKLDAEYVRTLLIRYLPLMEFLDGQSGFGSYVIKLHGRRPVKIWHLSAPQMLDQEESDGIKLEPIA